MHCKTRCLYVEFCPNLANFLGTLIESFLVEDVTQP